MRRGFPWCPSRLERALQALEGPPGHATGAARSPGCPSGTRGSDPAVAALGSHLHFGVNWDPGSPFGVDFLKPYLYLLCIAELSLNV